MQDEADDQLGFLNLIVPRAHLGCRYYVDTPFFENGWREVCRTTKRKVIAVNIFTLEYTVLLVAFLIVAYNTLKGRGGDKSDRGK